MKVLLTNGKGFEALGVHGRGISYQGIQRDSLIFLFDPKVVEITDVIENFTENNCSVIVLTDDEGNTYYHENYTVRIETGVGFKEMALTGVVSGNDRVQSVYVRMAQTTLAERVLEEQQKTIDELVVAVLEG